MDKIKNENVLVLYDKDDVEEFNKINNHNVKEIITFSPGIEEYIYNKKLYKVYKFDDDENLAFQKEIISNSEKIYSEFNSKIKELDNIDEGLTENFHNIFFVSIFSFFYLIENLKKFENFFLIKENNISEFNNFKEFIREFLTKISNKKNQGFFEYIKPKKKSYLSDQFIKISNFFCLQSSSNKNYVVGSLLSKKLLALSKNNDVIELKSQNDFRFYHLIINFSNTLNFFSKKKYFFFPEENFDNSYNNIKNNINKFISSFENENLYHLKSILIKILSDYNFKQLSIKKSLIKFVENNKIKMIFVDQLRFGVSTVLSSICKEKKIKVILVPHGSISTPQNDFSRFALKVCARGLIYSSLASHVIAQSKISYDAIKYYKNDTQVIKSLPILYGKEKILSHVNRNEFTFLHASTPKSLSKWPWIYENYSEYVENIKIIIEEISKLDSVKLIIRFREGPECDLDTFKKITKIDNNSHVIISKNKNFFDDLKVSNCLISYSSTAIEETLSLNKQVLIYSNNKDYKHINYPLSDESIVYANKNNINFVIKKLIFNKPIINNNILWEKESLDNQIVNLL